MELLERVDLTRFAAIPAGSLAYGRKRTLEIATTLAMDPQLMLLDEPTAGMGHEDVDRVKDLIKEVAVGRTVPHRPRGTHRRRARHRRPRRL